MSGAPVTVPGIEDTAVNGTHGHRASVCCRDTRRYSEELGNALLWCMDFEWLIMYTLI